MQTFIKLSIAEALAAESAIAPTRPWYSQQDQLNTYHYAIDPDNIPADADTIDFPLVDDQARAAFIATLLEWQPQGDHTPGQIVTHDGAIYRVAADNTLTAP
jgi:hypothetical protein